MVSSNAPPEQRFADREDLARIREFIHRVMRGSATQVVPTRGGFAVLNRDFPASYEHNCLVVEEAVEPSLLMQEAERVQGGAGLLHRTLEVELEQVDPDWTAQFRARGFAVLPTVTMALRHPPGRESTTPVARVSYDELKPVVETGWRRSLPLASPRTIAELVNRRNATSRACAVTHHVVRCPEGIVARADLYRIPPIAQIENVETEPDWQNRGYATAVVLNAIEVARSGGCDLIFLLADADDWPQHFYRRLGFVQVGGGFSLQLASVIPSTVAE